MRYLIKICMLILLTTVTLSSTRSITVTDSDLEALRRGPDFLYEEENVTDENKVENKVENIVHIDESEKIEENPIKEIEKEFEIELYEDLKTKKDTKSNENYNKYLKKYGHSFVIIDIKKQEMIVFKNKKLIAKTAVVTGTNNSKRSTKRGTFKVYFKQRNRTLTGKDYKVPVRYWIAFNGRVGIHDAYWRSSFGGKVYYNNGSRGCINVPPKVMSIIYNKIDVGTSVYVI